MKRGTWLAVCVIATSLYLQRSAAADVTGISMKFGGGCRTSNVSGACVLKPRFSGFELETETAVLYQCKSSRGNCRRYSNRRHPVSEAGEVYMRIKNIPGACFQVRTGPNGNDKPDVKSRILCER